MATANLSVALFPGLYAATLAVTACGDGDDTDSGGESSEPLTFWTLESEPNRVAPCLPQLPLVLTSLEETRLTVALLG